MSDCLLFYFQMVVEGFYLLPLVECVVDNSNGNFIEFGLLFQQQTWEIKLWNGRGVNSVREVRFCTSLSMSQSVMVTAMVHPTFAAGLRSINCFLLVRKCEEISKLSVNNSTVLRNNILTASREIDCQIVYRMA